MNAHAVRFDRVNNDEIRELTNDEIVARIGTALVKRHVGLSVQAFISNFRQSKLDDPGKVSDLIVLLNLIPDAEQLKIASAA